MKDESELVKATQEVEEQAALPPLGPFSDISDDESEKPTKRFSFKTDEETIENSHKR